MRIFFWETESGMSGSVPPWRDPHGLTGATPSGQKNDERDVFPLYEKSVMKMRVVSERHYNSNSETSNERLTPR